MVRTPDTGWGASSSGAPTLRANASGTYRTTTPHYYYTARRFQRQHRVSSRMCNLVCTAKQKRCLQGQAVTQYGPPHPAGMQGTGGGPSRAPYRPGGPSCRCGHPIKPSRVPLPRGTRLKTCLRGSRRLLCGGPISAVRPYEIADPGYAPGLHCG